MKVGQRSKNKRLHFKTYFSAADSAMQLTMQTSEYTETNKNDVHYILPQNPILYI